MSDRNQQSVSSFGFFSLASVPNVPVRCLSVFSSLPVLDTGREMEREFSHLVEKRRPNRGGAPPVGQCRMLRVLRLHPAELPGCPRGNGRLCSPCMEQPRCCARKPVCNGGVLLGKIFNSRISTARAWGAATNTFKQHGHGVRCNRVRGAAARRQRGDLAALSRPPPLEFPLELPLLPAVPRPPRVPHRAPSAATKSKKQRH